MDRPLLFRKGFRWQDWLFLAGKVVVGRTGWLFLAEKVVVFRIGRCCLERFSFSGQVVVGRKDCRRQDRLLLAGQIVVGMKGYCWQGRLLAGCSWQDRVLLA
jgi:hypothetical protein